MHMTKICTVVPNYIMQLENRYIHVFKYIVAYKDTKKNVEEHTPVYEMKLPPGNIGIHIFCLISSYRNRIVYCTQLYA